MVWSGLVWYGMVWYGMVWYGMVWYGMALLTAVGCRAALAFVRNPTSEDAHVETFRADDESHDVPEQTYRFLPGSSGWVLGGPDQCDVLLRVDDYTWTVNDGGETEVPNVRHPVGRMHVHWVHALYV